MDILEEVVVVEVAMVVIAVTTRLHLHMEVLLQPRVDGEIKAKVQHPTRDTLELMAQ